MCKIERFENRSFDIVLLIHVFMRLITEKDLSHDAELIGIVKAA